MRMPEVDLPVKANSSPVPERLNKQAVSVHNLGFESNDTQLLDAVSFQLKPQGITLLMGANGAGKSLLLRLLHGLLEPSSGEILWGGGPCNHAIRQQQAMVFQRPVLLRRSVAANIRYVLKLRREPAGQARINAVLERVELAHLASRPARLLSGGEQQRLTLARALALQPAVLFLDEPTASLDPASTAMIENIVTSVSQQGSKVLFVSHDIGQARRLAEDVIFLNRGALAEHSQAATFFSQPQSAAGADFLAGRLHLA